MVDSLGNDGANEGAWRFQLRDRFGKFAEMGGEVSFEYDLPGVDGTSYGVGIFVGNKTPEIAFIEVRDNSRFPRGTYEVSRTKITAIKAILDLDTLVENPDGSVSARSTKKPAEVEPQDSVIGSEIQKKKLASITKILKAKGRFAVPRQTETTNWGKTSDVSLGAKADYKQVYDASPKLQEKYKSPEELWDRVLNLSVDTDTSSPNDLSQIPEDMKEINREYAKHFLGLKEDGLITVYRNSVGNKNSEIDAAAGYVSTDNSFAYDYNSKSANVGANGRYEIDVKPDEVFGMLGYSKPEDEFAFVIGTGVTSQPGRVRRVGDIAPLPMPAPWLQDYEKNISYATGSTPYRHHALGGQFNFHEVEDFGKDTAEFFAKYNLTAADIKSKFDELNGSGAYEEYKASDGTISFGTIRKMFVDLPNGNIGLDITKIPGGSNGYLTQSGYGDGSDPESYKNDRTDTTLKMLSVFQELTGKPFFTHRSRDYIPTGDSKLPPPELLPANSTLEVNDAEKEAIEQYTDTGYWEINKHLRDGAPLSPESQKNLQTLLSMIDKSPLEEPKIVYRGRPVTDLGRLAELEALQPGDTFLDRGIMSTSKNYSRAQFYAQMELDNNVKGRVVFEINLPAGQKALAISDSLSSYGSSEEEILLPPNTSFKVNDVSVDSKGRKHIVLTALPATTEVPSVIIETDDTEGARDNYAGTHAPPGPFSDVSADILNIQNVMPDIMDKTKGPQYYRTGHNITADKESFDALYDLTGDPNQIVDVYRAVPEGVETVNDGDWVSLSRTYAEEHLERVLLGKGSVISKKAKASELYTDGDSINEFGWDSRKPGQTRSEDSDSSRLTDKNAIKIWNPARVTEFDEKAAARELYDLMLQEGVTAAEIAVADPAYREYKKIFPDAEDDEDWAIDLVEKIRREWNGSPGDSDLIQAIQPIAKKLFGLQNTSEASGRASLKSLENSKEYLEFGRPAYEAFIKAAYKNTQKFFEERGIKTLVVYRGMVNADDNSDFTEPKEVEAEVRPLSSWSVNPFTARAYTPPGGVFTRAEIPVSQVLSTAFSGGLGTQVEQEVVLLGPPEKIMGVLGLEFEKLAGAPDSDAVGVIDVVSEESAGERIAPGYENWMPVLTDILALTADSESEDNNFDPELGDKRLSTFMERAGYNLKPKVVSAEEFNSTEGETLYRGVLSEKHVDQYMNSSKHFAGGGNFGNGTYSSNDKETAVRYAAGSENNVLELKLSPDANVQKFNSRRELLDWTEATLANFREEYLNSGASNEEYYESIRQLDNVVDYTNVAVMLGIDAIEFPHSSALDERYTIILNRGKVIVNGKS